MQLTVSDADLARVLKPAKGAPPRAQVRVLRAILVIWGNVDSGKLPNLAEIGRRIGVRRQVVSDAIRVLRNKGVLVVTDGKEPIVSHRRIRMAVVKLPDLDQLALPLFPEPEQPEAIVLPLPSAQLAA